MKHVSPKTWRISKAETGFCWSISPFAVWGTLEQLELGKRIQDCFAAVCSNTIVLSKPVTRPIFCSLGF
jgi:hypothetical protein